MRLIIKILSISLVIVSMMPSLAYAKTSVWKVSKAGNTLYLGGTVHLLASSDYPLPAGFEHAYKNAQAVVLETDILAASGVDFQMKSIKAMTFQDGRSLSSVLDVNTYKAFSDLIVSRNLPLATFERFTPAGATLVLTAIEMQKMGMVESLGVDKHFHQRALSDNKPLHYLETIDEQLGFIESLNTLDPNKLIRSSIKQINDIDTMMSAMLSGWKQGDLGHLNDVGIKEMQRDFPSMYQVLLVQRNNAWMQRLAVFIESPEVEFVMVGALHMAGKQGLIAKLKSSGYTVQQMD